MQFNFEVADHLCTVSVTTSQLNPALLVAVVNWQPTPSVLTLADRASFQRGKEDVLQQAANLLHVYPMLVEPKLPAATAPPRARRPAGEIPHMEPERGASSRLAAPNRGIYQMAISTVIVSTEVIGKHMEAVLSPSECAYLFALDDIAQQAGKAKAGRSTGAAKRNQTEGEAYRNLIVKAIALVPIFSIKPCHRAREVRKTIKRFGPAHFGLERIPDRETINRTIAEILEDE